MLVQEAKILTQFPTGKILIQGEIKRDSTKWFRVPFCIAKGCFGLVGYIVLLHKVNALATATQDFLDDKFPGSSYISSMGALGLERDFFYGQTIIGFDTVMMPSQLNLEEFVFDFRTEDFNNFISKVIRNAYIAYDDGFPKSHQDDAQGELWEN